MMVGLFWSEIHPPFKFSRNLILTFESCERNKLKPIH